MYKYGFDVAAIGFLLLIVYIIFDFRRNKTANTKQRLIFYSYILYLIIVFQLTTGGINIPPVVSEVRFQLVPFLFIKDLIALYQGGGLNWHFWNSFKLSIFNLIMLLPLGIYFPVLYNEKEIKKVIIYVIIISFSIEIYQTIFTYYGLIRFRQFNIDDIFLNTMGAIIGYYIYKLGARYLLVNPEKRQ